MQARKGCRKGWLQLATSALALTAALFMVGRGSFWRQFLCLRFDWLTLAAALLLVQVPIMAARWQLFAQGLAVPLQFRRALREYFLAAFLNQVLPLGVLGDVTRVARHARASAGGESASYADAALAAVLDRTSGQMGLWLSVLAVLPAWASEIPWRRANGVTTIIVTILALVAVIAAAVAVGCGRLRVWDVWRTRIRQGMRALLAPSAMAVHLPLSLVLIALHIGAFLCIARALGFAMPIGLAMRVVPLVLVATSLPIFVGGWGVREAAMAGLYHAAGMASANGVSISVVYGVLSVLVSLPGLWVLRPRFVAGVAYQRSARS